MGRRQYEDDDGRVIADMSGVERPSLLGFRPAGEKKASPPRGRRAQAPALEGDGEPLTREERRIYILAALKAALLIGGVFIAGLGLVILAMVLLW